MSNDPLIDQSHEADAEADRVAKAANLFDLRRIIGALFAVYGVILVIVGLTDSDAEIDKAAGIHINLYTGIGMLIVAGIFIGWAMIRPLSAELEEPSTKTPGRGPGGHADDSGEQGGSGG